MSVVKDLSGNRFGKLTVLCRAEDHIQPNGRHRQQWMCQCDCAQMVTVTRDNLVAGRQKSCGCERKKNTSRLFATHGLSGTRLYGVWSAMKARCYNPHVREYRFYGARGIKVCEEWKDNFGSFRDWMISNVYDEDAPRGQCTIDRINPDGDYCPENCRIISQFEQMSNLRSNRRITFNGTTATIAEWARKTGIDSCKISHRLAMGWTPDRALTTQ